MAGETPLFVDAFLNVDRSQATVILSLTPLYTSPHVPETEKRKWGTAAWQCSWTCPSQFHLARSRGTVLLGSEAAPNEPTQSDVSGSQLSQQFSWFHHSMVVGCPLLSHSNCSDLVLGITAVNADSGAEMYKRTGISVQQTAFVREGTELVLCTMYDAMEGTELVWPWAKYHIMAGFQQILVYVESTTDTTEMLLNDLVRSGYVTLVPFYFGSVSSQHKFYMQAAMEQHCLFQARGRAAWVGHNDVDEFFELRPATGVQDMKQFLRGLPERTSAVMVQSQFWQVGRAGFAAAPFPCGITCKHQGYLGPQWRTKWISKPTEVMLGDPHSVGGLFNILQLDPSSTLRLNHFRLCRKDGGGCDPRNDTCVEDTSFASLCAAAVNAALPSTALAS